jgi:hypothetical protein
LVAVEPPPNEVPEPCLLATVAARGCPDSNSKAVTVASVTANKAAADSATRLKPIEDRQRFEARLLAAELETAVSSSVLSPNRCATAESTAAARIRSRVRSRECLYTALPTTEMMLPRAAPMTVPATPKNEAATVALTAASTLAMI